MDSPEVADGTQVGAAGGSSELDLGKGTCLLLGATRRSGAEAVSLTSASCLARTLGGTRRKQRVTGSISSLYSSVVAGWPNVWLLSSPISRVMATHLCPFTPQEVTGHCSFGLLSPFPAFIHRLSAAPHWTALPCLVPLAAYSCSYMVLVGLIPSNVQALIEHLLGTPGLFRCWKTGPTID